MIKIMKVEFGIQNNFSGQLGKELLQDIFYFNWIYAV